MSHLVSDRAICTFACLSKAYACMQRRLLLQLGTLVTRMIGSCLGDAGNGLWIHGVHCQLTTSLSFSLLFFVSCRMLHARLGFGDSDPTEYFEDCVQRYQPRTRGVRAGKHAEGRAIYPRVVRLACIVTLASCVSSSPPLNQALAGCTTTTKICFSN